MFLGEVSDLCRLGSCASHRAKSEAQSQSPDIHKDLRSTWRNRHVIAREDEGTIFLQGLRRGTGRIAKKAMEARCLRQQQLSSCCRAPYAPSTCNTEVAAIPCTSGSPSPSMATTRRRTLPYRRPPTFLASRKAKPTRDNTEVT